MSTITTVSTAGPIVGWAWTALSLYVVGLVLAIGLRTWVQLRRTGTTGFRGITGPAGSLAWWGGVLFPAALLLGLAAPVLVLLGATPAWGWLAHPAVAGAGLALGVAGLVVVLLAQHTMGASWRIGVDDSERTELVTTGVFARVRNPIFTGMAGVSAAVALMAPTPGRDPRPDRPDRCRTDPGSHGRGALSAPGTRKGLRPVRGHGGAVPSRRRPATRHGRDRLGHRDMTPGMTSDMNVGEDGVVRLLLDARRTYRHGPAAIEARQRARLAELVDFARRHSRV